MEDKKGLYSMANEGNVMRIEKISEGVLRVGDVQNHKDVDSVLRIQLGKGRHVQFCHIAIKYQQV